MKNLSLEVNWNKVEETCVISTGVDVRPTKYNMECFLDIVIHSGVLNFLTYMHKVVINRSSNVPL